MPEPLIDDEGHYRPPRTLTNTMIVFGVAIAILAAGGSYLFAHRNDSVKTARQAALAAAATAEQAHRTAARNRNLLCASQRLNAAQPILRLVGAGGRVETRASFLRRIAYRRQFLIAFEDADCGTEIPHALVHRRIHAIGHLLRAAGAPLKPSKTPTPTDTSATSPTRTTQPGTTTTTITTTPGTTTTPPGTTTSAPPTTTTTPVVPPPPTTTSPLDPITKPITRIVCHVSVLGLRVCVKG